MIPKIIHYCWFGGKPLPPLALKCIDSWRKYLPGYEIRRWDESNFDVREIPYISQAYDVGKYAFVSDYARFKILYENGGLYFDTDVEMIAPFESLVAAGPFMGRENEASHPSGKKLGLGVAPGLGLAVEKGNPVYLDFINLYKNRHFTLPDGSQDLTTVVDITSRYFESHGLQPDDIVQEINGIKIYPREYLCPIDVVSGEMTITPRTVAIHHYSGSWRPKSDLLKARIKKLLGHRLTSLFIRLKSK